MSESSGELNWYKSSYSNGEGSCVEVAVTPGILHVRDSKVLNGPIHSFNPSEWAVFVENVKAGKFDV
jgi:hypothetical protein